MRRWLSPLVLLLHAACAENAPPADSGLVRDSAGVRIIENSAPRWQPGEEWRLSPEPVVTLGEQGTPEGELFQVTGLTRLSDGRVVVANAGTSQLRFYDRNGRHIQTVGRPGSGPGEFQYLGWIISVEDSLLVYDQRAGRLSAFDLDGGFLTSRQLGTRTPFGRFQDASLLASTTRGSRGNITAGAGRASITFIRLYDDDDPVDTLVTTPGRGHYVFTRGGSSIDAIVAIRRVAFDTWPLVLPRGNGYVVVHRDRYVIDLHDRDSRLTASVRRTVTPRQVTNTDKEAWRREQLSRIEDANIRRTTSQQLQQLPYPDVMPTIEAVKLDPQGRFWIQAYQWPGDEPSSWSVFDPEGSWLGDVSMPTGLMVWEVGSDYILGLWRDEDDVEHVRMYELVKRER